MLVPKILVFINLPSNSVIFSFYLLDFIILFSQIIKHTYIDSNQKNINHFYK